MTNAIFTSKEHYFSFRSAWAESVNITNSPEYPGSISSEQHMLYNILRGSHPERGFTRISNTNKLQNGMYYNHASFHASIGITCHIDTAKTQLSVDNPPPIWLLERMERFLKVFKGTVTIEMLANVQHDKISPISI